MRSCRARIAASALTVVVAMSAHLHPNALGLRELVQRGLAEVAAMAGLLDATVGDRRVDHLVRVDPDRSDAQRTGRAVCAGEVVRPDAGGEAVLDVVGDAVRLLLGGEL